MKIRSTFLAIVLAVVVAAVAVAITSHGRSTSESVDLVGRSESTSTTTPAAREATSGSTIPSAGLREYTTPGMPVAVKVVSTTAASDGAKVVVHVDPSPGSQLFGIDARLCKGGVPVRNDGEFIPTQGGNCTPTPLSATTDARVSVEGRPPYSGLDLEFRAGVGTKTFATQSGASSTVTCDRSNPCQVVMKLQYPNGFGFQSVPVSFP